MMDDLIFSLDIGTRTVIGIVGKYENEVLNIIASDKICHEKRAMYDGQIHDINSVVRVAKQVKENLEEKIGFDLKKVAVAAAGRSLETSRAKVSVKVDSNTEIDIRTIKSAEIEAVQAAEKMLKEKENVKSKKYYCVGHTVISYFLDDVLIENLEGHKGDEISIDLIATFLPHTVIDSLGTVMDRLNLEIVNMTLEPIAAINVAVKKNLRLLNIALVDIGAGTSDMAITKDGTISSYAMVPLAGDEITECLVKTYLLDYDIAEELKINLSKNDEHEFSDIIGTNYKLTTEEILDKIDDSIRSLANSISEKIIDLNEGSPSVMFLIGGGSQIPRLNNYISEKLEIPVERVDIKDASLVENVSGIDENISGPDSITPIGIAVTAIESNYKDFIEVSLNEKNVKIFNTKKAKITDALLLAGFNPRNLISKRGQALNYYINGLEKQVLGEVGLPAKIYLNGEESHLENRIKDKDKIQVISATTGDLPKVRLFDVVDKSRLIYLDNEEHELILNIYLNGEKANENITLSDGDKIETLEIKTIKDLFSYLNIDIEKIKILIDDKEASNSHILRDKEKLSTQMRVKKDSDFKQKVDDKLEKTIELSINGEKRNINYNKDNFQFVDVFDYIDFDLKQAKGNLVLKINDKDAKYLETLKNGDVLKIYWDE